MRLTSLSLEKYGAIEHQHIDLSQSPGLTLIYGPNEAGKSTCLSAVADFFFGIPPQSVHGALFGYESMRIGASLQLADGRTLQLQRRKGRGRTLLDAAGAVQDDAVLTHLLGGTSRERYGTLFGLNHETLRLGGERLLAAEGEIGRLIVEAGGGLRALIGRLAEVEAEAARHFAPRRANDRAFYQALDAFHAAQARVEQLQLSHDRYRGARDAAAAAAATLQAQRSAHEQQLLTLHELERLVRVVPKLQALDGLTEELDRHADVAGHPADFAERLAAALTQQERAAAQLQEAQAEHRVAAAALVELATPPPALLAAEASLRDFQVAAGQVRRDRDLRPPLEAEAGCAEDQLRALREQLQLPLAVDLAEHAPAPAARAAAQQQLEEERAQAPALAQADERAAALAGELQVLEARIETAAGQGLDTPLDPQAENFAELPSRVSRVAAGLQRAQARLQIFPPQLQALGFDGAAALRGLACPSLTQIQAEARAQEELGATELQQRRAIVAHEAEVATAVAAIDRLQAGRLGPSLAELQTARRRRAEAFVPLREAHLAGQAAADAPTRAGQLAAFLTLQGQADALVDRQVLDAQRSAELTLAVGQRAQAVAAAAVAAEQLALSTAALQARQADFAAAFPAALQRQPNLAALLHLAQRREALLQALEQAEESLAESSADVAQLEPNLQRLGLAEDRLALVPLPAASPTERVQRLSAAIWQQAQARASLQRDVDARAVLRPTAARAAEAARQQAAMWTARMAHWPAIFVALGLPPQASAGDAKACLVQWTDAQAAIVALAKDRQQLATMDRAEASLIAAREALAARLVLALPVDAVAAAEMLGERLQAARAQAQRHQLAGAKEGDLRQALALRQQQLETADVEVAALAALVGAPVDDRAALQAIVSRCRVCASLRADAVNARRTATELADGQPPEHSRRQWGGRPLDLLRAQLAVAGAQAAEMVRAIEAAVLAERAALDVLTGFSDDKGVNRAVAERERASAQMHAAVERYVELSVAHELVIGAIQAIRGEQQDPLVRRAGVLFARASGARYSGVDTDVDASGQPVVVGRRQDGSVVKVAAMSDGTRDQLFLAFRLASLEAYAAAAEPLPLIADDILVHFDDRRSAATLELLAEIGKSCQVLLFTHHDSVRRAAAPLVAQGLASVIALD